MNAKAGRRLAGVVFLVAMGLLVWLSVAIYEKRFVPVAMVTLETDSVGNAMRPGADVKVRGVVVGTVRTIISKGDGARLQLAIDPEHLPYLPSNVTAQLLPTTLFGERYVALIPPASPSPVALADRDVITQDRSANAIELERVLADLLPMLQTVQPEKLSVTLTAMSQSLESRGDQLGQLLRDLNSYLAELNPSVPRMIEDIQRLAAVADSYADAAPDLVDALHQFTVTSRTLVDEQEKLRQMFTALTTTAEDLNSFVSVNRDVLISLAGVGRPTLEVFAKYAPAYPCLLRQLADFVPNMDKALGKGSSEPGLHVSVKVVSAPTPYRPGVDTPRYDLTGEPQCYPTPYQGTLSFASVANAPQESAFINEVLSPALGVDHSALPPWSSLLVGPLLRGNEVSLTS
jgi:phospholipid/cholesterol/gamma-HCH transport system substrate-binding protein